MEMLKVLVFSVLLVGSILWASAYNAGAKLEYKSLEQYQEALYAGEVK